MMNTIDQYHPKFNAVEVMRTAVAREFRRKKALGQYVIVGENHKPRRIDFSLIPESHLKKASQHS